MAKRMKIQAVNLKIDDYIVNHGTVTKIEHLDLETDGSELMVIHFAPMSVDQDELLEVIR